MKINFNDTALFMIRLHMWRSCSVNVKSDHRNKRAQLFRVPWPKKKHNRDPENDKNTHGVLRRVSRIIELSRNLLRLQAMQLTHLSRCKVAPSQNDNDYRLHIVQETATTGDSYGDDYDEQVGLLSVDQLDTESSRTTKCGRRRFWLGTSSSLKRRVQRT